MRALFEAAHETFAAEQQNKELILEDLKGRLAKVEADHARSLAARDTELRSNKEALSAEKACELRGSVFWPQRITKG